MINEPAMSSDSIAVGTTTVLGASGLLWGVLINPAAAACSITVYDNASAGSGVVLAKLTATANGGSQTTNLLAPIYCKAGITVVVAGTGATAICYFTKGY